MNVSIPDKDLIHDNFRGKHTTHAPVGAIVIIELDKIRSFNQDVATKLHFGLIAVFVEAARGVDSKSSSGVYTLDHSSEESDDTTVK